jgi:acyl-CoA dehydrogenase
MRSPTDHLGLPFFDPDHREIGNCLADWLPKQSIDESDDRRACRDWVRLLGANQWLRYCVAKRDGGMFDALDSRALVILRENLAFHSPLADFAFAMQGLGSGAITLAGTDEQRAKYLHDVASGKKYEDMDQ